MKDKIFTIICISLFIIQSILIISDNSAQAKSLEDIDPLVDLKITFKIEKIRSLERLDLKNHEIEWIDFFGKPDFYVKLFINEEEFKSPIWRNQRYVYNPEWEVEVNVPDDKEFVNITIQLWDWELGFDKICDISGDYYDGFLGGYDVNLRYSLKTGHWYGGDYTSNDPTYRDQSGYGRLNGCDDGSQYEKDRDCELWFDITQNDYDGDGIPYWTEINEFDTNPEINDIGDDEDNDGIPIEWEFKWGYYLQQHYWDDTYEHIWFYDPFEWNDHENIDVDIDSINNIEEYLTSEWESDPFRQDVFVELDQMEGGPNGERESILSGESKEFIYTAFNRQNLVLHIDDGSWTETESDMIPFDSFTPRGELQQTYYWNYFLNKDEDNWRKGVFHYGMVLYDADFTGYAFNSNAFQISSTWVDCLDLDLHNFYRWVGFKTRLVNRDIAYASVYMHELGHTFGFWPLPGHEPNSYYPWQIGWWKARPYKSCMNYGYMYRMVDYSDGTGGKNDFDDWERIDLSYFERSVW